MVEAGIAARAAPRDERRLGWNWLIAFGALYVSFGATFGFLAMGAPLILRVRGAELAEVGILQIINLPLGLTFLWAGIVDRLRIPGAPHRLGWIVALQVATVGCLVVLAFAENASLGALLAIGVATAFCVATMDVSLEALVVETVSPEDRPLISSAKFCGASLGGMIGAGALVGSYDRLGWFDAVAILAAIDLVCVLPLLAYPEHSRRLAAAMVERHAAGLDRLRHLARHIAVLGFYFAALHAVSGLYGLALLDIGLPLATTGLVSGTLMPAINFATALAAAPLVRRFGTVPLITVCAAGLLAATLAMAGAKVLAAPHLAVGAMIFAFLCSAGLGVPVFNMLYRWSEGPRPASDYAILFGASFFASMPVRIGGPAVAASLGWAAYFVLAAALYALAFALLRRTIARTLADAKA